MASIEFQKLLQVLAGMAKNDVEGKEIAVLNVAIARQGINGENVEGVAKEDHMTVVVRDACPACFGKVLIEVTMGCGLAMALWLADCKRKPAISPLNDGIQANIVTKQVIAAIQRSRYCRGVA